MGEIPESAGTEALGTTGTIPLRDGGSGRRMADKEDDNASYTANCGPKLVRGNGPMAPPGC